MKKIILILNIFLFFVCCSISSADTDKRVFHHSLHSVNPKEVSILFDFTDINRMTKPLRVWDGLWVRIININHSNVKEGVYGYKVQFASDQEFNNILLPTNQPRHGITADNIAAFHFRNSNNSGPNEAGPRNVNAPQEVRRIMYNNFEILIRILNFEITGIENNKSLPAFAGIEFIIVVNKTVQ